MRATKVDRRCIMVVWGVYDTCGMLWVPAKFDAQVDETLWLGCLGDSFVIFAVVSFRPGLIFLNMNPPWNYKLCCYQTSPSVFWSVGYRVTCARDGNPPVKWG